MAPETLFLYGQDVYLNSLTYASKAVDVFQIDHFPRKTTYSNPKGLDANGLRNWLQSSTILPNRAISGFRLVFGLATEDTIWRQDGRFQFPHDEMDMKAIEDRKRDVPFSKETFELILQTFQLPTTTPWMILSPSSHFQQYLPPTENGKANGSVIGYTMRRFTRGILAMDIALSISFNVDKGLTCAVLLGCTQAQQDFICQQLEKFASLARHPLLLPALLTGHQQVLLNDQTRYLWEKLLDVEEKSGQTGAPRLRQGRGPEYRPATGYQNPTQSKNDHKEHPSAANSSRPGHQTHRKEKNSYNDMTIDVLTIIQSASTWESFTEALLFGIECIRKSSDHLDDLYSRRNGVTGTLIKEASEQLTQWLNFVEQKSKIMLWDIKFIDKRAQAQTNAIYNYMTQHIATATKHDSSAMRAIAILTMVFLPGTFMATFFAMPFFNFSASGPDLIVQSKFWYYWVITVPLTVLVIILYFVYLMIRARQQPPLGIRQNIV